MKMPNKIKIFWSIILLFLFFQISNCFGVIIVYLNAAGYPENHAVSFNSLDDYLKGVTLPLGYGLNDLHNKEVYIVLGDHHQKKIIINATPQQVADISKEPSNHIKHFPAKNIWETTTPLIQIVEPLFPDLDADIAGSTLLEQSKNTAREYANAGIYQNAGRHEDASWQYAKQHAMHAQKYYLAGLHEEAAKHYEKAGQMYQRAGLYKEAAEHYAMHHEIFGRIYEMVGQHENVVRRYVMRHMMMGQMYEIDGKPANAAEHYGEAGWLDKQAGRCESAAKHYMDAVRMYRQAGLHEEALKRYMVFAGLLQEPLQSIGTLKLPMPFRPSSFSNGLRHLPPPPDELGALSQQSPIEDLGGRPEGYLHRGPVSALQAALPAGTAKIRVGEKRTASVDGTRGSGEAEPFAKIPSHEQVMHERQVETYMVFAGLLSSVPNIIQEGNKTAFKDAVTILRKRKSLKNNQEETIVVLYGNYKAEYTMTHTVTDSISESWTMDEIKRHVRQNSNITYIQIYDPKKQFGEKNQVKGRDEFLGQSPKPTSVQLGRRSLLTSGENPKEAAPTTFTTHLAPTFNIPEIHTGALLTVNALQQLHPGKLQSKRVRKGMYRIAPQTEKSYAPRVRPGDLLSLPGDTAVPSEHMPPPSIDPNNQGHHNFPRRNVTTKIQSTPSSKDFQATNHGVDGSSVQTAMAPKTGEQPKEVSMHINTHEGSKEDDQYLVFWGKLSKQGLESSNAGPFSRAMYALLNLKKMELYGQEKIAILYHEIESANYAVKHHVKWGMYQLPLCEVIEEIRSNKKIMAYQFYNPMAPLKKKNIVGIIPERIPPKQKEQPSEIPVAIMPTTLPEIVNQSIQQTYEKRSGESAAEESPLTKRPQTEEPRAWPPTIPAAITPAALPEIVNQSTQQTYEKRSEAEESLPKKPRTDIRV